MKWDWKKDDQKVFRFINDMKDIHLYRFDDLTDFLKDNKLPLFERWAFYFFGKMDKLEEFVIERIYHEDSLEASIEDEMFFWRQYLNGDKGSQDIFNRILDLKKNDSGEEDLGEKGKRDLFVYYGWEHVKNRISNLEDDNEELHFDNYSCDEIDDEPFCEACQSYGCMCSDKG